MFAGFPNQDGLGSEVNSLVAGMGLRFSMVASVKCFLGFFLSGEEEGRSFFFVRLSKVFVVLDT